MPTNTRAYKTSGILGGATTNGETLVADSSATTGLRWTATPSASNPIINGAFDIWQRGTSITGTLGGSTGTYTADRWNAYVGAGANTVSRQSVSDSTNLPNIQYCLRMARDSGQTSTNTHYLIQMLETATTIPMVGKTVTVSFYARKGANYSATSDILKLTVYTGTGTDQNINTGYTGLATAASQNFTLTTTWQRFTLSASIATTANELSLYFERTATGTAGAADYFEMTGVQIDIGSVALPFRRAMNTLAGELAACQRYYYRNTATNAYGAITPVSYPYDATQSITNVQLPVTMRIVPTSVEYANLKHIRYDDTNYTITAVSLSSASSSPQIVQLVGTISGATAGQVGKWAANNNTAAYLGLSAEL